MIELPEFEKPREKFNKHNEECEKDVFGVISSIYFVN